MQSKGRKRNTIDKFYTITATAKYCSQLFQQYVSLGENDLIIEPSAGNGAFIPFIQKLTQHYLFYDLEPAHAAIAKQDYLQLDYQTILSRNHTKIHIFGNPPFGRQSSLAKKFIKQSCAYCDTLSFILPKSFKKDSFRKTFPLCFHLIYQIDLPENSFTINGKPHNVPCVFQIWEKKSENRIVPKPEVPSHFTFVKKEDQPHISFRRVGVYAGRISQEIANKSTQSHYFIRFDSTISLDDTLPKLKAIQFELNNTAGPNSISKQELIKAFNTIIPV